MHRLYAACLTAALLPLQGAPAAPHQNTYCVLSVEEDGQRLGIFSSHGTRLASVPVGEKPHEVEVSPDGHTAYVSQFGIRDYDHRIGTPGERVVEVDVKRAVVSAEYTFPSPSRAPHGLKLRPGTSELFVNTEVGGDKMWIFDTRTKRVLRSFALPKGTHNFVFSRDGTYLFSFAGKEGVSKIDARSGKVILATNPGSSVRALAFARSGDLLASGKGEVFILDPHTLRTKQRLAAPVEGQLLYLTELRNGDLAVPAMEDNGVVIFSKGVGRFVPTGKAPIFARQAPDGQVYVSTVDESHLTVLSPSQGAVRRIEGIVTPNGLAFSMCPQVQSTERG